MPTKSDEIVQILEEQIIRCELEPGSSLFEIELSDRFNVSRTPVREALLKLERRGLLRSVPYKGFAVNPVSLKDLFDLYELRLVLETHNAQVAAHKLDSETAAEIDSLLARTYDGRDPDSQQEFVRDDHDFHLKLAELTNNERIKSTLTQVLKHLRRVYYLGVKSHTDKISHSEHREIIAAIKDRNESKAKSLMEDHITVSRQRALSSLE